MKTLNESQEKVISKLRSTGSTLSDEDIISVINTYRESLIETMVENGHTYVTNDVRLEIVKIQPRRYVLRGVEYNSMRTYKIKADMGNATYKKVEDFYNSILGG